MAARQRRRVTGLSETSPRQPPIASMADVARLAGVSTATVSRVLNNVSWPIAPETAERVLSAAAQLDYRPNHTARALVVGQARYVGVIVHDVVNPFFAEIVRGVEDAANREGYLVILCNSDRSVEKELGYLRMLRDFRVAGVILAGGQVEAGDRALRLKRYIAQIKSLGAAVVLVGPRQLDESRVRIHDQEAAEAMASYLLDLGHRRIGFITGPTSIPAAVDRQVGYLSALASRGLDHDPALVYLSDFLREGGRQAAAHFWRLDPRPTAIFAGNDESAIGCIAGLKQLGARVPADVSVVGFGDVGLAQYVDPPLTTVRVPLRAMGERAVNTLLRLMKGETADRTQLLPTELVLRASSAPPSATIRGD